MLVGLGLDLSSFLWETIFGVRYRTIGALRSHVMKCLWGGGGDVEKTQHIIILCCVISSCGMTGTCGGLIFYIGHSTPRAILSLGGGSQDWFVGDRHCSRCMFIRVVVE